MAAQTNFTLLMLAHGQTSVSTAMCLNPVLQAYAPFAGTPSGAGTGRNVLVGGSLMVEQATNCYQSRGVPLNPQETLVD